LLSIIKKCSISLQLFNFFFNFYRELDIKPFFTVEQMLEMEDKPIESLIFNWVSAIYNMKSSLSRINAAISNERKNKISIKIEIKEVY
jgi:hypothetical protein